MLTKSQKLLYALIKERGEVEDKTKLAKLQYFADFIHHAFNDRPLSQEGIRYSRNKQGPLSRSFNDDLAALIGTGVVAEPTQYHYKPSKDVDTEFSEEEEKTISYVLNKYGDNSVWELIDISHEQEPFLSANNGGEIELFTAYNLVDRYPDYPTYVAGN